MEGFFLTGNAQCNSANGSAQLNFYFSVPRNQKLFSVHSLLFQNHPENRLFRAAFLTKRCSTNFFHPRRNPQKICLSLNIRVICAAGYKHRDIRRINKMFPRIISARDQCEK